MILFMELALASDFAISIAIQTVKCVLTKFNNCWHVKATAQVIKVNIRELHDDGSVLTASVAHQDTPP